MITRTPRRQHSYPSVTDLFCGAGGSSQGAAAAGGEIYLAMNHSPLAIETHSSNFPKAKHDCRDISGTDPRHYQSTGILIASPECDWHTNSQGQKRYMYEENLFGEPLDSEAGDRSRATAFDVIRFADHHNYRFVIVENVWEFRKWRLYDSWVHAFRALGYETRDLYINSMICHPTPQSRDRFYFVAWRAGTPAPDLSFTPKAPCLACGTTVEALQVWKNPAKPYGRYGPRNQYVYVCPACGGQVHPFYYPAYSAIDFSIPAPIIGERKRPLAPKTMERIRAGLKKFADSHVLIETAQTGAPDTRAYPVAWRLPTQTSAQSLAMISVPFRGFHPEAGAIVDPRLIVNRTHHTGNDPGDPLSVVSSGGNHALLLPFLTNQRGGTVEDKSHIPTEPIGAQTAGNVWSLTVPPGFIASYYGTQADSMLGDPIDTIPTRGRHALVNVPFVPEFHQNQTAASAAETLGTITAGGRHHGLVSVPIIYGRYNGEHRNPYHSIAEPQMTIPGTNMHGLLDRRGEVEAEECGFRMLSPEEIGRGMAFPETYIVHGNKAEQVEQYGNAVTPPVMKELIARCLAVW